MSILNNNKNTLNNTYLTVSILGKSYRLKISYIKAFKIQMIQKNNEMYLFIPDEYKSKDNIDVINLAIKNLYDQIAQTEIENSMELIRHILNFAPEDYLIKRLNNEFYKSSKKLIVVSPDIVQYSREIINTTLIQAFCKTKYRANSNEYRKLLKYAIEQYENYSNKIIKVS